jgi:hypothetical protein
VTAEPGSLVAAAAAHHRLAWIHPFLDEKRMSDYDGRGYLSWRYLGEFCQFFLGTATDQVEFILAHRLGLPRRSSANCSRNV